MILTAHQPAYIPWLGLLQKIASSDVFVSYDHVQYQTYNYVNRNAVRRGLDPTALQLVVPVRSRNHLEKRICDVEIDNSRPWARKHWGSLRAFYARAPHFARYAGFLEDTYSREWRTIAEFDEHILLWLLETLGIHVRFLRSSALDLAGRGSDQVLDLCLKLGARTFIFGAHGRRYARVEDFAAAGVEIVFQDYQHPVYAQSGAGFVSHLSALDLLFHCGESSLDVLMTP